jgi:hypothetical protein
MLAHELAHVVQGSGPGIQRWSPFKKDDAATAAAKVAMKDQEARDKVRKKAAADAKKAEQLAAKEVVAAAKKREKDEDKDLAADRTTGVAVRGAVADMVSEETLASKVAGAGGGAAPKQGSKTLQDIQKLFAKALKLEEAGVTKLVDSGIDRDVAVDHVYEQVWVKQVWLPSPFPALYAVRPPRETESEKLAGKIREQRRDESTAVQQAKSNEAVAGRGKLLAPEVEAVYDRWETAIGTLVASGSTPDEADKKAEKLVWAETTPEIKASRPQPAVEKAARQAARDRRKEGATKAAGLETIDEADRGLTLANAATPIIGAAGGGTQSVLSALGKGQDSAFAKAEGKGDLVGHSSASSIPIVGSVVKAAENAKADHEHGVRDPSSLDASKVSVETQAGNGISACTGILNDVLAGAKAMLKAVKAIGEAHEVRTTENVVTATKASADSVSSLSSLSADAAKLAAAIDGGVAGSVAKVLPGFSIVTSVTNMVSGLISTRDLSGQQDKANQGLFKLRTDKKNAAKVDVLVRPLLLMISHLDKKYEKAVWSLIKAVSDTVLDITTLATAGGFGIPAAIQAGTKALDTLHSLGHLIDDNLRAMAAQSARKDSVGALEGAAEGQLRNDPAFAMDAIIMQAKSKKDPVALAFLSTYGISATDATKQPMNTLRERALFEMGVGADPLTTYQTVKMIGGAALKGVADAAVGAKDSVVATVDQYGAAKQLGADRTALDGKDRDWKWRLTMAFKSKESFGRSTAQTALKLGADTPAPKSAGPAAPIECKVGSKVLFASANEKQQALFGEQVKDLPLDDLVKAGNDPKTSETWRQILKDMVQARLKEAAKKAVPPPPAAKKAPALPPRPTKAPAASSSVGA